MRDRALPVLLAVVALVAVGTAGAALTVDSTDSTTAAPNSDVATAHSSGEQTVSVSADGSASATPDEAVVTVAVVADGDDTQAIRRDLANGSEQLRTALNYASVAGDQISTTDYRITESHRPEKSADAPRYRGVHAFEIRLEQTNATGGVVDAAADSGAEVTGVRFTLSEDTRTALRDEALQNAMADARQQADTLAAAGDLQVTGVASIDASDRNYQPVRYEADAVSAAAGGRSTTIESGDVSVSVDVRVVYNVTDA
ncbi:SIMPL domain-containing protein [Halorientalis brevis]|uniref:SIMPL domain-containing protein n=1 Tax=Halorientalis brevis TaxID=1126241 RepID=A0ABD6C6H7_9EURY|nr:SIMPL domain-containing protein [Halorientalis brevis]